MIKMKIIVSKCKCGHDVYDHNYKNTFCFKCSCEEFIKKQMEENAKK